MGLFSCAMASCVNKVRSDMFTLQGCVCADSEDRIVREGGEQRGCGYQVPVALHVPVFCVLALCSSPDKDSGA